MKALASMAPWRWKMGETAAFWIPGIVFASAGLVIAIVLPAHMASPIEERGFDPLTIVRALGWSVAVLGGIILLSIPLGREVERAFPQNIKVWHWWVNFIGGMLGALMFGVPATLTLPLLFWAYITRPNWVYGGDVESFWSVGYLGLLFTGLGILTLFFLYALGMSGYHRRPRWRLKSQLRMLLVFLILAALSVPARGMAGPPTRIVVGTAEIHRLRGSSMLIGAVFPIAAYDGVQFRKAAVVADEEHKLQKLLSQSILNRIRQFDLYLEGERVGVLRIRQIAGTPGCPPEIGGFGEVRPARLLDFSTAIESSLHANAQGHVDPTGTREREGYRSIQTRMLEVDAVSGLSEKPQEFTSRTQALSPRELASLRALGQSETQAAAQRTWRDVGRIIPRGDVLLEGWKAFDLNRDGTREIIVRFKAPLVKPGPSSDPGQPPPALVLTMVARIPPQGGQHLLLSLPTLIGVANASEMYHLSSALDLTGDRVAELVLHHIYAPEFSGYEIFSTSDDIFRRVFSGDVKGC